MAGAATGWRPKWRRFNRWRKRYWLGRTLILLAIFALPLYENLTGKLFTIELTRISVDALRVGYEPKLQTAEQRAWLCAYKNKLRQAIVGKLDLNRDGFVETKEFSPLSDVGYDLAILQGPIFRADLDMLIGAHNCLFPEAVLAEKSIRGAGLKYGLDQAGLFFQKEKKEIDAMLAPIPWRPSVLLSAERWHNGWNNFAANILMTLWGLGRYSATIPWVLICICAARFCRQALPGRWRYLATGLALIPVAGAFFSIYKNDWGWRREEYNWILIAAVAFSISIVLYQLNSPTTRLMLRKKRPRPFYLLVIGVLLVLMGLENLFHEKVYDLACRQLPWFWQFTRVLLGFCTNLGDIISPLCHGAWHPYLFIASGLVFLVSALGLFLRQRRRELAAASRARGGGGGMGIMGGLGVL